MILMPSPITIAHEMEQRIRLRGGILKNRDLDPDYFEANLETIPGVNEVRINTRAASVVVTYDGRTETRNAIINCLVDLPGKIFNGQGKSKTLLSILSLVVRGGLALSLLFLPKIFGGPIAVILAAPVVVNGVLTLWTRGIKVEVLDASAVLFCLVRQDFFTAVSIVFLLSVGEYLEELSENRTTGLLKSLLKPQVENIWIEVDGQELEIPLHQARIGHRHQSECWNSWPDKPWCHFSGRRCFAAQYDNCRCCD